MCGPTRLIRIRWLRSRPAVLKLGDQVTPLYGGEVIAVQVYPHRDEATGAPALEGALRENGKWYRVGAAG